MDYKKPLRYKISSWKQLPACKSNNDQGFRITVTEFVKNFNLQGTRISVTHPDFGVVFSEVLGAYGNYVTSLATSDNVSTTAFELDTAHILQELRKYGFFIVYEQEEHLPEKMLEYLNTVRALGFDKLRVLNVWDRNTAGEQSFKWYVVVFQSCRHSDWLNNNYSASKKEYTSALLDGTAMNISEMNSAKGFNWSWLDFVANIDDVIKDNMEALARYGD